MEFICIMCPVGCHLKVQKVKGEIVVSGNSCPRGEIFGKSEAENPTRMVTSVIPYKNKTISVKTSKPVPKCSILAVLNDIHGIIPPKTAKVGQILIKNVQNTGADIVVTGVNV